MASFPEIVTSELVNGGHLEPQLCREELISIKERPSQSANILLDLKPLKRSSPH